MSFLDFKNSKLSCVENDFYRTDVKINIITEKRPVILEEEPGEGTLREAL